MYSVNNVPVQCSQTECGTVEALEKLKAYFHVEESPHTIKKEKSCFSTNAHCYSEMTRNYYKNDLSKSGWRVETSLNHVIKLSTQLQIALFYMNLLNLNIQYLMKYKNSTVFELILILILSLFVCTGVLPACIYVHHMCAGAVGARRVHQVVWNWRYGCL